MGTCLAREMDNLDSILRLERYLTLKLQYSTRDKIKT